MSEHTKRRRPISAHNAEWAAPLFNISMEQSDIALRRDHHIADFGADHLAGEKRQVNVDPLRSAGRVHFPYYHFHGNLNFV